MIINTSDYNIIQNDVHVLTRTDDETYINTNCWMNDFNIESENVEKLLSGFDYKSNIMDSIKQYGHSPRYVPVLRVLTNPMIQTPDFNINEDVLAVALFLDKGEHNPTWLHFFEVNSRYRNDAAKNQRYKRTGESTLKSFQREYINQGIEGRAVIGSLGFYYKYGFKRIDERDCYIRWQPQR